MVPFWRDNRFWKMVGQVVVVFIIAIAITILWFNLTRNLGRLGLRLGFDFLNSEAGFRIGDAPIPYQSSDPYRQALLVGLVNSLRVMLGGIVLATGVGVVAGVARLSDNWLVRNLALVYVEVLRNTPLLLQLLFWYSAVFLSFPASNKPLILLGFIQLSSQGIQIAAWQLRPEFSALLLGLGFYTGTFIAEIVRGGIQSVPRGQWEAARSLGLKPFPTLWLVILPQALRAIIPSLANQYLNLAKNSSLAFAIGYADLYAVASTTFNQTGRAVEVMVLISLTYLAISLGISLVMNLFNRAVQIVER